MEKVDTLVVDKTGTLTEGRPAVTSIVTTENYTEAEVLRLAASVERVSEHPLAVAIVRAAKNAALRSDRSRFDSPTGKGALGEVAGKRVALGNARFLSELGVNVSTLAPKAEELRRRGDCHLHGGGRRGRGRPGNRRSSQGQHSRGFAST